ncbi:NLR family CARD domain-containing protein 4 [Holothuria leucospilota]|uniref:NLR family CARD domain-containing protein 4 n=1 Tax=Holothuria leucospilota TaxID=206669 RepID=A0A9Q1CPL9_HOLLE|nr:NLR family CARD domain-containing protein 4 [Holothuria leucospilota]
MASVASHTVQHNDPLQCDTNENRAKTEENTPSAFGNFLVDLQSFITLEKAVTLATAFEFKPAEVDNLQRSSHPGYVFIQLLRDKGIINSTDISALIKTLKACNLDGVADDINNAFQKLQLERVVKKELRTQIRAKIVFLQELRRKYRNLYDAVQPIPYIRDRLFCVNRVFVEGGIEYLIVNSTTGKEESWCKLGSYKDIFNNAKVKSDRRILEGEPGFGKSTLALQLVYDWCENLPNGLANKYDLVILLRLKQLGGVGSVFKAIKQFILTKESILNEKDIKDILNESNKVLIILDGFDEYPDRNSDVTCDVKRIIKRDMFQRSDVVLMTRTACLPKATAPQTQRIRLTGFDDNARDEYIRKAVVGNDEEAVKAIKRRLLENPVLADLCQVPLFFVMFAHMSHESEHLQQFKSVTSFFSYMIKCFHHHLKNKMKDENVQGFKSFEEDHSKLDEIAFEGLCKENQQLIWGKGELCKRLGEDFYRQYVSLGILVEENVLDVEPSYSSMVASNLIQEKTEVRFYHKLFCEWYAAHYVSSYASRRNIRFMGNDGTFAKLYHKILGRKDISDMLKGLDPFDLQYVFRFACGLNSDASSKIIEHLKNTENAHRFAVLCILKKEGKINTILDSIRDLCSNRVDISDRDTLLLQRSTIQLLDIATKNEVSIIYLWLL